MPEFRRDAITGAWAIVAEGRAARPNEYARPVAASAAGSCPFCEGQEGRTPPEVAAFRREGSGADRPGWSVRTIPNKFPTLDPEDLGSGTAAAADRRRPGYGFHEVVIESPTHAGGLATFPRGQTRQVLRMLRERVREVAARPRIRAVVAFENSGPESGGTLFHPHAQVVGLAEIPAIVHDELSGLARYASAHGGVCGYDEEIARERAEGVRMLLDAPEMIAYAPFASAHPYEVRIVPTRHGPSFGTATDREIDGLTETVPRLLGALSTILPGLSYNLVTRALAPAEGDAGRYHWHLEILPRLLRPDGFELGSGIPVNPISPEQAAEELRAALGAGPSAASGRPA